MGAQPSGTVTLVFTDIEGSTKLLEELGQERYLEALAEHRRQIRSAFTNYDGYEVDYEGDSFFYAFQSASAAIAAAQEAVAALGDGSIRVRMGIHTGEPGLDPPKYVGMDVHRAARIMACAHGGQAVLSQTTRDLLDDQVGLRDLGEHRLKDLSAPLRLYQLGKGDFPPLKTFYRTNLPVPATAFLGRQRELADVAALLLRDDVRLLTLTGPGGTGKTRLALQAAADAADRFPDGVWWVPLAPLRDPGLVLSALAQALAVNEQPGRELIETLTARLRDKQLLLLLDNAEHLLPQAVEAIATLRDLAGAQLIVTSRERLHLAGEQLYPVPALADPDAQALFTVRARQLEPVFEPSAALAPLCARLDNLPLAIELAAARTSLFTPEQLLERLGQRLDLLRAGRDTDPRQQTLRATIDWSYQLLDREEQRVFREFSVFAGGSTLEAAEEVCEADPWTFESLLDKSLLRRRDTELGPRYWMLETIREYAQEGLHESGKADLLSQRYLDFFVALADEAEPELRRWLRGLWLDRIGIEQDNLRAALEHASAMAQHEAVVRIALAFQWWWWTHGLLREAADWIDRALDYDLRDLTLRAQLLTSAAFTSIHLGDAERDHLATEAVSLWRTLADAEGLALALNVLGFTKAAQKDFATARSIWQEAHALAQEHSFTRIQAVAAMNLGDAALHDGRVEEGRALSAEALDLFREIGSAQLQALNNLGYAAMLEGDAQEASRFFVESLADSLNSHLLLLATWPLAGMAWVLAMESKPETAARALGAAEAAMESMGGDWQWMGDAIRERARAELRQRLTETGLAAQLAEGRTMSVEEMARYALQAAEVG